MGHELLSELWTLQLTTRIRGGLYINVRFAVFIIVRIVGGGTGHWLCYGYDYVIGISNSRSSLEATW